MKVTQLFELVNIATKETLGTETVVNEDLSNVVDIGKEIINTDNVDNYVENQTILLKLLRNQGFPDLIDISGTHSYQQIAVDTIF